MKPSKFVILANPSKDPEGKEIRRISEYLRSRGAQVWVLAEENGQIPQGIGDCPVLQEEKKVREMDMALILGGDGTMLSSARRLHYYHVPMLGINLGHLGFLTGCEKEDSQHISGNSRFGTGTFLHRSGIGGRRRMDGNRGNRFCGR